VNPQKHTHSCTNRVCECVCACLCVRVNTCRSRSPWTCRNTRTVVHVERSIHVAHMHSDKAHTKHAKCVCAKTHACGSVRVNTAKISRDELMAELTRELRSLSKDDDTKHEWNGNETPYGVVEVCTRICMHIAVHICTNSHTHTGMHNNAALMLIETIVCVYLSRETCVREREREQARVCVDSYTCTDIDVYLSYIQGHPSIPDCVLIRPQNKSAMEVTPSGRELLVDRRCAEAVLRGAHIYIPGMCACERER